MTWKEQIVIRILLLVARYLSDGELKDNIKTLDTHIRVHAPTVSAGHESS